MNNIPEKLLRSLEDLKWFDKQHFVAAHEDAATLSVRINPQKRISKFDSSEKVPWCESGFYLNERPDFTADPLFHAGCYYVQEASSMFIEHALKNTVDLKTPLKILDLCAAPGGKSTLIASLISNDSLLVSNEVIRSRVNVLEENVVKWGSDNVFITNNDPKDLSRFRNYFDVILVDAPCSGSGLFRKNTAAIGEWSEENVIHCSLRQQRILSDIIPALSPSGTLIYSTCSYSAEENEMVCDHISAKFHLQTQQIPLEENWGIVETASEQQKCFGYRFYPDRARGEGFFVSAFRKSGPETGKRARQKQPGTVKPLQANERKIINTWIKRPEEYSFFKKKNEIIAVGKMLVTDVEEFASLNVRKAGICLGEMMHGELIPSHELAMSTLLSPEELCVQVDKATALKYLKKENISLADAPNGWMLMCYENQALGWAKNIGNRINNYYPKNRRILKRLEEI